MRAFIALDPPEDFCWQLADLLRQLERSVTGRFVPAGSHHVTLAFLGDIGEAEAARAVDALDEVAERCGCVRLAPEGLGSFRAGRDKTLYLALARDEQLMALAQTLRNCLADRSLSFDEKTFVPHLTLARRAKIDARELGDLAFPDPTSAGRVVLYKSTLTPDGPIYKELYAVELGAPA